MSKTKMAPVFAIIGHPNEGKSSVLSTLAEDDTVVISPTPGETRACRSFPITIDHQHILSFVDTPGFQNPRKILAAIKKSSKAGLEALQDFRKKAQDDPELADDRELLTPILDGAAIIYVVDGSRPLRTVDKIEMEIMRLSEQPRMAIINCKGNETQFLDDWKSEFRKNFNVSRQFNAHQATYRERISLLTALKAIDQDLEPTLDKIVTAFKQDWQSRNQQVIHITSDLLEKSLTYYKSTTLNESDDPKELEQRLYKEYCNTLKIIESEAHQKIRSLFKHNIFNYDLPENSILHEDLFSEETWQLLGLSKKQVAVAGGLGGATIGATMDLAAGGLAFGIFTSIGTVLGSFGALFGGEKITRGKKFLGIPLGGEELKVGPNKSPEFPFILLDRTLLFYSHTINWAHGRRDYFDPASKELQPVAEGITRGWSSERIKKCALYFKNLRKKGSGGVNNGQDEFRAILHEVLLEISNKEKT